MKRTLIMLDLPHDFSTETKTLQHYNNGVALKIYELFMAMRNPSLRLQTKLDLNQYINSFTDKLES